MFPTAFLHTYWKENNFVIQVIQGRGWLKVWLLFMEIFTWHFLHAKNCMFVYSIITPVKVIHDFGLSRLFPRFWIWLMVKLRSLRSSWTPESLLFSIILYWLPLCEVCNLGKVANSILVFHLYRLLVISTLLWNVKSVVISKGTRVFILQVHMVYLL